MSIKSAIFVVGDNRTGKSTLIRSLTGAARNQVYNVKNGHGQSVRAFVFLSSPQEMGMTKYPPQTFPDSIEKEWRVDRNSYDVLISALRLDVRDQANYGYDKYIESVREKGFDVKVAVIEKSWNNTQTDAGKLSAISSFAQKIQVPLMRLNASNDPNSESARFKSFYP
jgi:GTPase SAR1 family protein